MPEATTTVGPESPETAANTRTQLEAKTTTDETTTANKSVEETEPSSEVDAEIVSVSPAKGTFGKEDVQHAQVTVENTGIAEHTFFVGYSVRSPTGEGLHDEGPTEPSVTLAPGESETVTVEWTVDTDAPAGTYGIIVAVWEDRVGDDLQNRLDRTGETAVFTVENTTA